MQGRKKDGDTWRLNSLITSAPEGPLSAAKRKPLSGKSDCFPLSTAEPGEPGASSWNLPQASALSCQDDLQERERDGDQPPPGNAATASGPPPPSRIAHAPRIPPAPARPRCHGDGCRGVGGRYSSLTDPPARAAPRPAPTMLPARQPQVAAAAAAPAIPYSYCSRPRALPARPKYRAPPDAVEPWVPVSGGSRHPAPRPARRDRAPLPPPALLGSFSLAALPGGGESFGGTCTSGLSKAVWLVWGVSVQVAALWPPLSICAWCCREKEPVRYANLMYDRRVVRGNTYALQVMPVVCFLCRSYSSFVEK